MRAVAAIVWLGAMTISAQNAVARWEPTGGPIGGHVRRLVVQHDRVILTGVGAPARSFDSGVTWKPWKTGVPIPEVFDATDRYLFADLRGELVRSDDFGDTWTRCVPVPVNRASHRATSITADGARLYVSYTGLGLFRSEDGCSTWTTLASPPWKGNWAREIIYAREARLVMWSATDGAFLSVDGGVKWEPLEPRLPGARGFATTCDGRFFAATNSGLFRSSDEGRSWTSVRPDFYAMTDVIASSCQEMFVVGRDGVRRSIDGGTTWGPAAAGLSGHRMDRLARDDRGGAYLVGVSGAFRWSAESRWLPLGPPDSTSFVLTTNRGDVLAGGVGLFHRAAEGTWQMLRLVSDPTSETHTRTASKTPRGRVIVSGSLGGTWVSADGGMTWSSAKLSPRVNVFLPMKDGQMLAATDEGIFRSTDDGQTWIERSSGLPSFRVRALAENWNGTVYAGTWDGEVLQTSDAGERWRPFGNLRSHTPMQGLLVTRAGDLLAIAGAGVFRWDRIERLWRPLAPSPVPDRTIPQQLVQVEDGRLWLATDGAGVLVSGDNGATWASVNDGLPTMRVFTLTSDSRGVLYAGTSQGVFRSTTLPE
jgi:photosystem II stability/assembly factor-like uncharacterized protein